LIHDKGQWRYSAEVREEQLQRVSLEVVKAEFKNLIYVHMYAVTHRQDWQQFPDRSDRLLRSNADHLEVN